MSKKLRRLLSILVSLLLLAGLMCPGAFAKGNSGTFGKNKNLTWKLEGSTLTISGKGEMNDFDGDYWGSHTTPWQSAKGQNAKSW